MGVILHHTLSRYGKAASWLFSRNGLCTGFAVFALCCGTALPALAQTQIPGSADVTKIRKPGDSLILKSLTPSAEIKNDIATEEGGPPPETKDIPFVLQQVNVEGATAFAPEELRAVYARNLNTMITLDLAWKIARRLRDKYHDAGYFLTDVYIPEQNITDGKITLKVIEGYVGMVKIDGDDAEKLHNNPVIKSYIDRILAQKPISTDVLESALLRLNDLAGVSFRSVLSPGSSSGSGVLLTLVSGKDDPRTTVSFDNSGSRFLGPHQGSIEHSRSFATGQQTNVAASTSVPLSKLQFVSAGHTVQIAPDVTLGVNGSVTRARPGFTLKPLDIRSNSISAGLNLQYQAIRQRLKNLSFNLGFDGKNVKSDDFGGAFVREQSRAVRIGASFNNTDKWQGQNQVDVTISQGVPLLGASDENDANLSRARATPSFTKLGFNLSRAQAVRDDVYIIATVSGQHTSDRLYSSEQFGYGGPALGRAYDNSEILGDSGIAAGLEMQYRGFAFVGGKFQPVPYLFYDIGKVWNVASTHPDLSGSSAGIGLRIYGDKNLEGNIALAIPLTKQADNPIYGSSPNGVRFLINLTKHF